VQFDTLTIFGAGLIGGSVALAARRAGLAHRIVALDQNPAPEGKRHPFDLWIEASDASRCQRAFEESNLIVLATPVRSIVAQLPAALAGSAFVTDCGSTKMAIVEAARHCENSASFVPGHPMAGHPVGGLSNASAELFDGRRWLLCPGQASEVAITALRKFVAALGARPVELSAAEHDRSVAITSHLPQVIASALAVLAQRESALAAAGPGFASATRVAGGADSIWRDIFTTNGQEIGRALELLGQELQRCGQSLGEDDVGPVLDLLERARLVRNGE